MAVSVAFAAERADALMGFVSGGGSAPPREWRRAMRHLEGFTFDVHGGLWARGDWVDDSDARDWMAWHFTPVDNLPGIIADGRLLPDSAAAPTTTAGDAGIKSRRLERPVPLSDYPNSCVGDHVPLYIAGKSPMLHRVARYGSGSYSGGSSGLVMLGFNIGAIAESGQSWCATDSNAVASTAEFTDDIAKLPQMVDFELLTAKWWNNTIEEPDRASRRAAEVLVYDFLPLELLEVVVVSHENTQAQVQDQLSGFDDVSPLIVTTMFP